MLFLENNILYFNMTILIFWHIRFMKYYIDVYLKTYNKFNIMYERYIKITLSNFFGWILKNEK
ncbi:hypothetical protein BKL73_04440 [Staphylococcus epidermidis]|nr:hypothetical protein BKL73_04440 [Staphylococcus epidermidis]